MRRAVRCVKAGGNRQEAADGRALDPDTRYGSGQEAEGVRRESMLDKCSQAAVPAQGVNLHSDKGRAADEANLRSEWCRNRRVPKLRAAPPPEQEISYACF
jgi:hypothetical protein